MGVKILVADDESNITDVCRRYLELEGYQVIIAGDGEEALNKWRLEVPDLMILDVMMPIMDGWKVCNEIRKSHDTPIIMLTAKGEEMDRLMGLTIGADDYMSKPFSPRELVLRVKAILRRVNRPAATKLEDAAGNLIQFAKMDIHPLNRTVFVESQEIELTVKEFDLLLLLASHPDQVFSRNQLLNRIWDMDFEGDATTVTVHIHRLRDKIESNPSQPKYIKTVWGIGYKFEGRENR